MVRLLPLAAPKSRLLATSLVLALACLLLECGAKQIPILVRQRIIPRGGARESSPPSWSASPFGIRRRRSSRQNQRYPIVTDLDEDGGTASTQETKEAIDAFLTRDSRNTFIARVYAILSGQLLVTAGSVVAFGLNPGLSSWMHVSGTFVPLVSLLISTIAWFIVASSPRARHASPLKWQLLSLFTIGEAISVGFISSLYEFRSVLSAMLATAVATVTVSLYTIFHKNPNRDLSQWGMGLSSLGMIFLVYGMIHLLELFGVLPPGFLPYRESVYSLLGAALFSGYLAYHTKLIVAGKHAKYQMNEKDYIFGAMSLYNDIINIFLYILRMIGEDKREQ